MCLLSNRGCKYIRQDIRPHQRRVSAGQVFCLCLYFLLIFISYHCTVLKQSPERKINQTRLNARSNFSFSPIRLAKIWKEASPTHPLGCGSCRARSISGRKDPANIVLLRSTKDRAAGSTLMRPVMIAATWALTTSPPCPCREQQQLMDNGHGMKVSSRPNALLVDV